MVNENSSQSDEEMGLSSKRKDALQDNKYMQQQFRKNAQIQQPRIDKSKTYYHDAEMGNYYYDARGFPMGGYPNNYAGYYGQMGMPNVVGNNGYYNSNYFPQQQNMSPYQMRQNGLPTDGMNMGNDNMFDQIETNYKTNQYVQNYLNTTPTEQLKSNGPAKVKSGPIRTGRKKIALEYIIKKSKRGVTFSKRKKGLMKKAHELSILTGSEALVLLANENGHVYTYSTAKFEAILDNKKGVIKSCLFNSDSSGKNKKKFEAVNDRDLENSNDSTF